jgi:hypothetical protein
VCSVTVALVLLPLSPSVAVGASVAYNVIVFPAETSVSVGVGTNVFDVFFAAVVFPVAAVDVPYGC